MNDTGDNNLWKRLAFGAMAGLAGTLILHSVRSTKQKWLPEAEPVLGIGYGITFGAAYAAMRPVPKLSVWEGVLLGLGTWAAGYLGWLPATGVTSPVRRHRPKQIVLPIAEHALYGIATVASYHWLQNP